MEEEINYKILRKIQESEKNSPILTELKDDFYDNLSTYLQNLNNRLNEEKSSQKQMLINDEIQNIKKIVVNIYEKREKKILLAVVSTARGGKPDLKNITNEEKILFDKILDLLLNSRKRFLEIESRKNGFKEIETEQKEEIAEKKEIKQMNHNPIIRITQDIPEFIGTDEKKYSLRKNDILSLPEDMCDMLTKKNVAERVNQQ